ncbi:MAG: DUF1207 domain-containing protein, partial [Longimicrobiales bacterium]
LCAGTNVGAQTDPAGGFLPRARYFTSPFADPIEPRFAVGLLVTDVLAAPGQERQGFFLPDADDARSDWQASAAVGGTLPLWRALERPEGGIVIGAQAGVFARFRVELPSRDDLGQDWVVAMPIEAAWNEWSGRLRISHRSSHLGDEFVQATDAERIEFGGEALDALTAYHLRGIGRVYAGGSWIFRSYTDGTTALLSTSTRDRFLVQIGADGQWKAGRDNVTLRAGVDWQVAERTDWEGALAIAGGVAMQHDGRSLGLVARYFDGVSSMGQFFITPERFISLELVADF